MKLRIPARVVLFLEGTHAWRHADEEPEAHALFARIAAGKFRADGSTTVDVDATEAAVLHRYADLMADSYAWAEDDDQRADLRAATAVVRAIETAIAGVPVTAPEPEPEPEPAAVVDPIHGRIVGDVILGLPASTLVDTRAEYRVEEVRLSPFNGFPEYRVRRLLTDRVLARWIPADHFYRP